MTTQTPDYLSPDVIGQATDLLSQGDVSGAWQVLADHGDGYADDAAHVTGEPQNATDKAYQYMVHHHWDNVTGSPDAYNNYYNDVAKMHLTNYLNMLSDGKIPTTNDIVDSYISSLAAVDLPPATAFDAAWESVFGNSDWAKMLSMDPSRIDDSILERSDIDPILAAEAMLQDGLQTMQDLLRDGGIEELYEGMQGVFGDIWNLLSDGTTASPGTPLSDVMEDLLNAYLEWLLPKWFPYINPQPNQFWESAQNWRFPSCPIVLDLDGDGIETTSIKDWGTVRFDHDNDGVKTATGWVMPDDGLLVRDINGNGAIDSGGELFGDHTLLTNGSLAQDGFAALADVDANADGQIDSQDTVFDELRVWQDTNQDGVSQSNELHTLSELGITSISTGYQSTNQDLNGNTLTATGSYTREDGSVGTAGDLLFDTSNYFTEFTDQIAIPETLQNLPDLHGSGQVRDLKDAAALSGDLSALLQAYSGATTKAEQEAILDELIGAWSETSQMPNLNERALQEGFIVEYRFGDIETVDIIGYAANYPYVSASGDYSSPGARVTLYNDYLSAQGQEYQYWHDLISVLEHFNGETFIEFVSPEPKTIDEIVLSIDPDPDINNGSAVVTGFHRMSVRLYNQQLDLLQQSYDALRESVYRGLLLQTRLKPYMEAMTLTIIDGEIALDFSNLETLIDEKLAADDYNAIWDIVELDMMAGDFLLNTGWNPLEYLASISSTILLSAEAQAVLSENDVLYISDPAGGALTGTRADESLAGADGNDDIDGAAGADRIHGGRGDDTLRGGDGDDILLGGEGNDTLDGGKGFDFLREMMCWAERGVVRMPGLEPGIARSA